ncbi:unnamed protein product [Caenorhabditis bovis]|uniref:SSD domain-containing protein n=1 Tax=Caenorhabditis bovis TaxID=2654633 RepID=A0A8S1F7U8_9PELO|nr:unnamed protein product [Caenorhabditis bovis]
MVLKRLLLRRGVATKASTMRAWVSDGCGIELRTISKPIITKPSQVLLKVKASSVNPLDVEMSQGYGRELLTRWKQLAACDPAVSHFPVIPGRDCSAVVEAVGGNVHNIAPGDEVIAVIPVVDQGTHAEYVVADSKFCSKKPERLSFEEAAALPYVASTAYAALRVAQVYPENANDQRVLIHGGSGGVGSAAIQLLKAWGCQKIVTTCSKDSFELVSKIGAIPVDYSSPNATQDLVDNGPYDVVFDTVNSELAKWSDNVMGFWRNSVHVSIVSPLLREIDKNGFVIGLFSTALQHFERSFQSHLRGRWFTYAFFVPSGSLMRQLTKLTEEGKMQPIVQRVMKFEEMEKAYEKVSELRGRGKTVINVPPLPASDVVRGISLSGHSNASITCLMHVTRLYSRTLYLHPFAFLIVPIIITTVVPIGILYWFPIRLSPNAEVGFDTKDTALSGPRLAWARIQPLLMFTNRISFSNPREIPPNTQQPSTKPIVRRVRRSWADNLLQAINQVACYDAPIPLMDHLSQIVLEVDHYDDIFDLNFLEKLCAMQSDIAKPLARFDSFTPYRNIWSVANMFACISPNLRVNCTQLDETDIKLVREVVDDCWKHRDEILECRSEKCNGVCEACKEVPSSCSTQIIFDLFYRILPKHREDSPFLVNTFLPVFTLTGYITQQIPVDVLLYDELENGIMEFTKKKEFKLKGLLMDVKRDRLLTAALKDSLLALLAAFLVMLVVAIHSQSLLYAFVVILLLGLSVVGALGVYSFFTDEFPLLNLVTFVLLIAIGSDDAFLLRTNFPKHLNEDTFHEFLMHTSFTMFLTCFSTVVPFFINITSNVIVFRCFGLFAGVTVIFNYFLVVSFLPAFLLVQHRHLDCFPSPKVPLRSTLSHLMYVLLPHVLVQGRFLFMALLSVVAIGGAAITYEGLHLPEYNPLQLFTSDNLHEWYDNNAERHFEFVAHKIALPLTSRLVWGVEPIHSTSTFRANATTPLRSDPLFGLRTPSDVRKLANELRKVRRLPFIEHPHKFWPERFLEWSDDFPCAEGFLCCNMTNSLFSNTYLDFCLRNSTSYLPTSYNDTPIFDNETFALVGYTAMLPTHLKYNHRFALLSDAFNLLEKTKPDDGWWAPEWWLMSTWFDLLTSIVADCQSSVIGSLVFVAMFAFIQLKFQAVAAVVTIACVICTSSAIVTMLGWVLGVLEAVILVLVVGLSFDYTLHYGAALPDNGCSEHRIREATARGVGPVTLAAFTSFLAGASMLFAKTHAFYQVGIFLVVISITSWTFSTFFYLPMLSMTLPRLSKTCNFCDKSSNLMQLHTNHRL